MTEHDVVASDRSPDDGPYRPPRELDWSVLGIVFVGLVVAAVLATLIAAIADVAEFTGEGFGFDESAEEPGAVRLLQARAVSQLVYPHGWYLALAAIAAVGVNRSGRRTMPTALCVIAAMVSAATAALLATGVVATFSSTESFGPPRWTDRTVVAGAATVALLAAVVLWREAVALQPFVGEPDDDEDEDEDEDDDDDRDELARLIPDSPR